ncbi:MAG: NrfD/PsrC family molybdoenzyme membrane anchor subunit [Saprospiraceae bacterium]
MTIFAVMCAGLFPQRTPGRPWFDFFMFPYPNTRGFTMGEFQLTFALGPFRHLYLFPQFLSCSGILVWCLTLQLLETVQKVFVERFTMYCPLDGQEVLRRQRWESLSLILAGLATPLVLSVHTIVSFDFATSVIPGWHTTIFPPYFVAGAIFSGFAMVQTLMIMTRKILNLQQYITLAHIESMNKVILLTGTIVGTAYLTELFIAWYSGYIYEQFAFYNRALGPYYWSYIGMMFCNLVSPQIFWSRNMRRNIWVTFLMSIFVNIGMWFERFVIIATTLARDYLPSSWSYYSPSWVEMGIFIGTFGIFFTMYLIFARVAPVVAVAEIKHILKYGGDQYIGAHDDHAHQTADEAAH